MTQMYIRKNILDRSTICDSLSLHHTTALPKMIMMTMIYLMPTGVREQHSEDYYNKKNIRKLSEQKKTYNYIIYYLCLLRKMPKATDMFK